MEKYHVLVIEDDIEIANAIKIYLQNQGYDVYVGNDGIAGLEIVEKETIHLAIVDIMMPRMDGLTMVAKLREKYDFPVIFLSAKSEDIDKIANFVRTVPDEFINEEGNNVTDVCLKYILPLIEGETAQKYEHGLPVHMVIERS